MLNPVGLRNNKIIHINNLELRENGKRCGCICLKCGANLIARMGEKNIWHFAHEAKSPCDYGLSASGGESPIHKYAKQIIYEERVLAMDKNNIAKLKNVKIEYKENNTILDLFAINENDEELGIEIFYKHEVDQDKLSKLEKRYDNVLEIKIPSLAYDDFINDKTFREGVLYNYPRKFLINNGFNNNTIATIDKILSMDIDLKNKEEELNKRDRLLWELEQKSKTLVKREQAAKERLTIAIDKENNIKKLLEKLAKQSSINNELKEIISKDNNTKLISAKMLEVESIKNKLDIEKSLLNKKINEHHEYFKKRERVFDERFQELDEMGRNLVEINKKKWLDELFEKKLISKLDYENIKNYL